MFVLDWDSMKNQVYECTRCHLRFKGEELIFRDQLKCPRCGYWIMAKTKPPIVKKVKAI